MFPLFGLNKYAVYGILAAIAAAVIIGYVLMWKASIRREALLEFNNKQLEQTIKEQQKFVENLKTINDSQRKIIDDMNAKNEALSKQLDKLETYLNSDEAKKSNRDSSALLKNTIKEISGQK